MNKLKFTALLCLLFPTWVSAFAPPVQIKVESDWYTADPQDVKAVLDSATVALAPYMGGRTLNSIVVRNEEKGPISLYEHGPNNEYVVLLDVKGRYWAQLTYQFAHEMCHLYSNYDLAPNNVTRQQWFEESLCEAFSLFALERMADTWKESPPYENWKDYSAEFNKYGEDMLKQKHRSFVPKLSEWYREQKATLETNPYAKDREMNEKFASYLRQVFEKNPQHWAAINYINLGEDTEDKSLAKYLNDWYENTPSSLREPIAEIKSLLDIDTQQN